jgi:hypothetical protein
MKADNRKLVAAIAFVAAVIASYFLGVHREDDAIQTACESSDRNPVINGVGYACVTEERAIEIQKQLDILHALIRQSQQRNQPNA